MDLRQLIFTVCKAQRRQCPCYMHLCGDCQDSLRLLELADGLEVEPQEGSWERYQSIKARWQKELAVRP
jgi:hypothetical protein